MYLVYLVKIGLYVAGGIAVISATPGLGSIGDFGSWWSEPIVFQKCASPVHAGHRGPGRWATSGRHGSQKLDGSGSDLSTHI